MLCSSSILYETKTNFVKNAAITTLPTAYGWLLGVTILMFWCRTEDFKLLINVLIGKALFSVYYLVIKNVHERDFIDYLLPYMTIFERIVLSDHVFMVIFSGIVLYILKRRDEKQPTSQLKSFFIRCKQASLPQDKFLELEDYSMALYSFQPYKED